MPRPSRVQALALYCIAAAGLFAILGLRGLVGDGMGELAVNLLYYLPFVLLPGILCLRKGPGSIESLRPNPVSLFDAFSIVVLAALSVFFVDELTILWAMPLQALGLNVNARALAVPTETGPMMLLVLYGAVLPGICEEFLFRGSILPAFERMGTRRAAAASALLFMLLHGSLVGAPGQLILGIVIAELVIFCDSIYAGMIFHTAYNAGLMIIQFAQARAAEEVEIVRDYFSYFGGWEGVLTLLVSVLLMGGMIRFSLRVFAMRARLKGVQAMPEQKIPFSGREKRLLGIGIALAAALYLLDIVIMCI